MWWGVTNAIQTARKSFSCRTDSKQMLDQLRHVSREQI